MKRCVENKKRNTHMKDRISGQNNQHTVTAEDGEKHVLEGNSLDGGRRNLEEGDSHVCQISGMVNL